MPRLMVADEDTQVLNVPGPGNFQFSAIRPEKLGASEYTLATIVCDITGSVNPFSKELRDMIIAIVESCKKHPREENLLLRLVLFNSMVGVHEVHGFLNLSAINPNDYDTLNPGGGTPLFDATYSSIGATLKYAENLALQDFDVNGCVYIITDGDNKQGSTSPGMIAKQCEEAIQSEDLLSLTTILIGIFDPNDKIRTQQVSQYLDRFHKEAKLSQYVDAGDATPQKLAKVAGFVSESISSNSQALANKTVSQPLTF